MEVVEAGAAVDLLVKVWTPNNQLEEEGVGKAESEL